MFESMIRDTIAKSVWRFFLRIVLSNQVMRLLYRAETSLVGDTEGRWPCGSFG